MEYKSPPRKLVQFFQKSRDAWKKKARATKKELKLSKNRIRFLEGSKAKLKTEVTEIKQQLSDLLSKHLSEKSPPKQVALKK